MPCITLLTDHKVADPAVAAIKGSLLCAFPDKHVIDIPHNCQHSTSVQAGYILKTVYRSFPQATIHLCLFHGFVSARYLLSNIGGQYFLAPDNGVLPFLNIHGDMEFREAFKVKEGMSFPDLIQDCISVIRLLPGVAGFEKISSDHVVKNNGMNELVSELELVTEVIYIDMFGNVIFNLTKTEFEEARRNRSFKIEFMRNGFIEKIHQQYNEVSMGDKVCRFNSAGHMEIGINHGDAARLLGFHLNDPRNLIRKQLKIKFE